MELGINVCLHRKFFQTAHPKRKFPFQSILAVLLWTVLFIYLVLSSSYLRQLAWTFLLSVCCEENSECLGIWIQNMKVPKEGLRRNKDKIKMSAV